MTIQTFVGLMGHDSLRVFDVNLRQNFYSLEVIEISLGLANVFKLDVNELSVVKKLLGFSKRNDTFRVMGNDRYINGWHRPRSIDTKGIA